MVFVGTVVGRWLLMMLTVVALLGLAPSGPLHHAVAFEGATLAAVGAARRITEPHEAQFRTDRAVVLRGCHSTDLEPLKKLGDPQPWEMDGVDAEMRIAAALVSRLLDAPFLRDPCGSWCSMLQVPSWWRHGWRPARDAGRWVQAARPTPEERLRRSRPGGGAVLPSACAHAGPCPRPAAASKLLRPSSLRHRPSHAASPPSLDLRTCRWCGGWDNAYDHYSYWRILDQFPAETRAMVVLPREVDVVQYPSPGPSPSPSSHPSPGPGPGPNSNPNPNQPMTVTLCGYPEAVVRRTAHSSTAYPKSFRASSGASMAIASEAAAYLDAGTGE